jgi:hypothetical protein
MTRQAAVLVALVAIAVAALFISVGSLILLRRSAPGKQGAEDPGPSST